MDIKSLTLCMIGLGKDTLDGELGGITRLQKLLYLLEVEESIPSSEDVFNFQPHKVGPYSSKLYDTLEFLENLDFITSEVVGESTEEEIQDMSFEDLISSDANPVYSDAYVERCFKLTTKGKNKVEILVNSQQYKPFVEKIKGIKSKFENYSLKDLLYYVCTKYPEMTIKSDIKNQILKRGF